MNFVIREALYHVRIKGTGKPVLFLHGFTGDSSTWDEAIDQLSQNAQCIAVDLPGHGKTKMPNDPNRFSTVETCKDLADLLLFLEIQKVDVVGYSMGGRLALSFACLYPEKVGKLVLESASPGLVQVEDRLERQQRDENLAQFIEVNGIEAFVNRWEAIPLFESQKALSADIQQMIRSQRLTNDPTGLAMSLREMGTGNQPSWWDRLSMLTSSTLLIVGEKDPKFCAIADKMQNLIPSAKKSVILDAGHAIHVEQPRKFGTMLMEFLING